VKFLVDAQMPARLARSLRNAGHDARHTTELMDGNRTTDRRIAEVADEKAGSSSRRIGASETAIC